MGNVCFSLKLIYFMYNITEDEEYILLFYKISNIKKTLCYLAFKLKINIFYIYIYI